MEDYDDIDVGDSSDDVESQAQPQQEEAKLTNGGPTKPELVMPPREPERRQTQIHRGTPPSKEELKAAARERSRAHVKLLRAELAKVKSRLKHVNGKVSRNASPYKVPGSVRRRPRSVIWDTTRAVRDAYNDDKDFKPFGASDADVTREKFVEWSKNAT